MLQILAITGPIYIVVALGFFATRAGLFAKTDLRNFGGFVARFALPALVFMALSQRSIGELLDVRYLFDYAAGSLLVMSIAFAWGWWRQSKGATLSALCGLGMSCSNSGYLGYPIAAQVLGPSAAAVALAMCMLVENVLMIPLMLVVAEGGESASHNWRRILIGALAQLLRNPLVIAIAAGVAVSALKMPVYSPIAKSINIVAASSTALALFVIGGSLVGLHLKNMRRDVSAMVLGKIALHPLSVALFAWLLPPLDPPLRVAAVLFASMPMTSLLAIFGLRYSFEGFSAAALLLTTVVSFASVSTWVWLLGPWLSQAIPL